MNDKKTTTDDTTVRMEKVTEKDITAKIEKAIDKNTKCNKFEEWIGKCITNFERKIGKCITTCANKIRKYIFTCGNKVSKFTNIHAKKISETKLIVIMNAKYNEVYGDIRKALMKIICRLAHKNETKEIKVVEKRKELDATVTTINSKKVNNKKINIFFLLIFKKIVAVVKWFAIFVLNAITILVFLVARVLYYITKEILYACIEIALALKDDVIAWYRSGLE